MPSKFVYVLQMAKLHSFFMHACLLSCYVMSDSFVTPWTISHQVPLSMGFSRQEYWSKLPFPSPGDLPNLGIQPVSPVSPALAGGFLAPEPPGTSHKKEWDIYIYIYIYTTFVSIHLLMDTLHNHVLVIINNAVENLRHMYLLKLFFTFFFRIYTQECSFIFPQLFLLVGG